MLAIIILVVLCFPGSASEFISKKTRLSEMTEDECMEFILSNGVEIPEDLATIQNLSAFVKQTIIDVENDPNYECCYGYYVTVQFVEDIKTAVNNYYGNKSVSTYSMRASGASLLKGSTLYGEWLDEYSTYNCYAYAIGYTKPESGEDPKFVPGYFDPSTRGSFSVSLTVAQLAELTKSDLKYLGHSCVRCSTDYEDILPYASTSNIICLRKMDNEKMKDFHYMKYYNSQWLHKPGTTHVLKLNGQPYDGDWYCEGVDEYGRYATSSYYYTGTIYYFAYKDSHNFTSRTYTAQNYHNGNYHHFQYLDYCPDCDNYYYGWEVLPCSGPPCQVSILQSALETHCK